MVSKRASTTKMVDAALIVGSKLYSV